MDLGLAGKVVLVTGGARGIGAELARAFAAEGAHVAVNYLTAEQEAAELVAELKAGGVKAAVYGVDVGDYQAVKGMVGEIEGELGPVDVLVNNAGSVATALFADTTPADWERVMRTSLYGAMGCVHAVLPSMTQRKTGRIISLAGDSSRVGEARISLIATARGGLIALTKSVAKEVGRFGITLNVVSVGLVETHSMLTHNSSLNDPAVRERIERLYALRRIGRPEDPVGMILLLASERGSWVTGQVISVNGGYVMP